MQFSTDKPDRWVIHIEVPGGTCIAIWVETSLSVHVGTLLSSKLCKLYPAASEVLRVGVFPLRVSN